MIKFFTPFFLFVVLFGSIDAAHIHKILNNIPQDDREILTSLFFTIFSEDQGCYALFGDKPIALSSHFTCTPSENIIEGMKCGGIFWKKWEVWEKYNHLFQIKKYLLLKEESCMSTHKVSNVIFINKEKFIKVITKHLSLFEQILERKIIPEEILENIELKKVSFTNSIDNNQILWGILLGYGKHNSILYNRRNRNLWISLTLSEPPLENSSIQLKYFGDHSYNPLVIEPVYFVADQEHKETKFLEKKYKKLRGKISEIYSQGDFLEITLSQLTSNNCIKNYKKRE
jgi:hypothetical protein